jgi:hypothetical protein
MEFWSLSGLIIHIFSSGGQVGLIYVLLIVECGTSRWIARHVKVDQFASVLYPERTASLRGVAEHGGEVHRPDRELV